MSTFIRVTDLSNEPVLVNANLIVRVYSTLRVHTYGSVEPKMDKRTCIELTTVALYVAESLEHVERLLRQ